MFEQLTERLGRTLKQLRGQARLSEDNIQDALREVRMALLEADVALPVVKNFLDRVREQALGQEVLKHLNPGQVLVKIVHDELVQLMGQSNDRLDLSARPPAVVLMAGLQGSGKTTTVAKLARWLKEREKKKVLLVSADVYRPAAILQLQTLAREVGVECAFSDASQKPQAIAEAALDQARKQGFDVLIVDTAGRLHIDAALMTEIQMLHQVLNPVETLFVVDSMTGQDAVNTAKAFNEALALTGVVLTKTDGDARGGAALSIRAVTGKPIKFLGIGEKTQALEPFHPERMASRILGMGDVVTLVEDIQRQVDQDQAQRMADKLKQGKGFDLADFREQLRQMDKLGGMASIMEKLPGMGEIPPEAAAQMREGKEFKRMAAIIDSMTPKERRYPHILKGSRKRRIANGSGTAVQDINKMLKQFEQMQRMMKQMGKGGLMKMMKRMNPRAMLPGRS